MNSGKPQKGNPEPSPALRGRCRDYLAREYCPDGGMGSASHPESQDDDIVHPPWEHEDKCNAMVVGSNPTRGAKIKMSGFMPGVFISAEGLEQERGRENTWSPV